MSYSHRNGETEPPTERGWYWFYGKHVNEKRKPVKQKCNLYVFGGCTEYRDPDGKYKIMTNLSSLRGKWWGPLVPPWQETVST
jgi:hypothetical protein